MHIPDLDEEVPELYDPDDTETEFEEQDRLSNCRCHIPDPDYDADAHPHPTPGTKSVCVCACYWKLEFVRDSPASMLFCCGGSSGAPAVVLFEAGVSTRLQAVC